MPLSPEKGSSATNIMPADWAKDVQALVRRHKYNFDAAAKEVGEASQHCRLAPSRWSQHVMERPRFMEAR